MTRDVTPIPKETRAWQCRKDVEDCTRARPCPSCRGRRNRRAGLTKQRAARKALETVTGTPAGRYSSQTANEELWRLATLCEVKEGAQVGPIATRFLAAETQAFVAKAFGDPRPFLMVAMPKGWGSEGIVLCRLSELGHVVEALSQ